MFLSVFFVVFYVLLVFCFVWLSLGYRVRRLKRVRIMNVELGDLPAGKYRPLDDLEMRKLRELTQGAKS
jgi:16S rRNA U516 pseudouridylate synthase RsuA-like enzyme